MRVALSRSTDTLVILEPLGAPILAELGLADKDCSDQDYTVQHISADDLIDLLRTEEMSELEVIEGHLDEVDDLIERERWTYAYHRTRRAYVLACQLGDVALQRETQSQYIQGHIAEAASHFYTETWEEAHTRNREAYDLAIEFGDSLSNELRSRLEPLGASWVKEPASSCRKPTAGLNIRVFRLRIGIFMKRDL